MPLVLGTGTLAEVQIPLQLIQAQLVTMNSNMVLQTAEQACMCTALSNIAVQSVLQTGALATIAADLTCICAQTTIIAAQTTIVAAQTTIVATQTTIIAAQETLQATAATYWMNRSIGLDLTTIAQIALQLIQLGFYYDAFNDRMDDRDLKIDAQIDFMQSLEDFKFTQDLAMLNCKKDILTDLGLPSVDLCGDAIRCAVEHQGDGRAVDTKGVQLAGESCGGIPSGWGMHEGTLFAAKAGSYAGGIVANAAKRDLEEFREVRTGLMRAAQVGMKGVFRSDTILSKYAQAAAIHSGLADIFLQGFNSAGAGLGAAIGSLAGNSNIQPSGNDAGGNSGSGGLDSGNNGSQ